MVVETNDQIINSFLFSRRKKNIEINGKFSSVRNFIGFIMSENPCLKKVENLEVQDCKTRAIFCDYRRIIFYKKKQLIDMVVSDPENSKKYDRVFILQYKLKGNRKDLYRHYY